MGPYHRPLFDSCGNGSMVSTEYIVGIQPILRASGLDLDLWSLSTHRVLAEAVELWLPGLDKSRAFQTPAVIPGQFRCT